VNPCFSLERVARRSRTGTSAARQDGQAIGAMLKPALLLATRAVMLAAGALSEPVRLFH
jgi:hypothetical protein